MRGVATLEAPVTGGVHLAATGEITVIVGGDAAVAERCRPLFEAMGGRVFHVGPLGRASDIKVITNMLAFVHLVACGEALVLAGRAGLDLRQAWEVIAASSGTSFVHETEGQVILNGSYDIGFTIDLALKDLGLAATPGRRWSCGCSRRRSGSTCGHPASPRRCRGVACLAPVNRAPFGRGKPRRYDSGGAPPSAVRRATNSSSSSRIASSNGGCSYSASAFFHTAFARCVASNDPDSTHCPKFDQSDTNGS
jgi:hypothetical protein